MLAGRGAFPGAVPAGNGKRRARHGTHPSDPPPGEIRLMGVESIRFDCLALLGGQLRRFELRYGVRAHRWTLWQFLDRDVPADR